MAGRMNLATLMMLRGGNNRGEGGGNGQRRNEYGGSQRSEYGNQGAQNGMWPFMPPYAEPGMRRGAYTRSEYDGSGMEDRRRGYARSEYDGGMEDRRRYETRSGYDGEMMQDRRMGFGEQPMDNYDVEMRRRRRKDGTFMHYGGEERGSEPIRFGGMVAMEGGKHKGHQKMTREMAEEWVESMEGSDPAKPRGGKWTMEQVKPIAQKYGVPTEGEKFYEFWAVMNAMYSDYYPVAKKYNVLTPDYFADLAMAFINDKDAVEGKTAMYYECIVEK